LPGSEGDGSGREAVAAATEERMAPEATATAVVAKTTEAAKEMAVAGRRMAAAMEKRMALEVTATVDVAHEQLTHL